MIGSILAVFLFEWKRALTLARLGWLLVLAAFPAMIMGIVRFNVREEVKPTDEGWREFCAWMIFALIPMLVSMLGTLLWTTPAISVELERRSWVYLAVRPYGSMSVLLGKYLAAVTWIVPPALVSLTIAVFLAGTGDFWRIWSGMARLVLLSCPAYAAIYLLFGVLIPRRAMVVAVAYTLLFELLISFVPAVINKMTVQYRLRALAAKWCKLQITDSPNSPIANWFGNEPVSTHVSVLLGQAVVIVFAAVMILRISEFSTAAESDN